MKEYTTDFIRNIAMVSHSGTGKTMMAKAVANATEATFISMVGSEFVQKYLGEGPRMGRDVFRLARENSPCIVFIDEVRSRGGDPEAICEQTSERLRDEFGNSPTTMPLLANFFTATAP